MKWILCEDRLPKNDDWEIITILDEHGDTPYRYSDFGWYFDTAKCWIVDAQPRTDVIAWMPLPPPYKADRKTENSSEIPNNCEDEPQTEEQQDGFYDEYYRDHEEFYEPQTGRSSE